MKTISCRVPTFLAALCLVLPALAAGAEVPGMILKHESFIDANGEYFRHPIPAADALIASAEALASSGNLILGARILQRWKSDDFRVLSIGSGVRGEDWGYTIDYMPPCSKNAAGIGPFVYENFLTLKGDYYADRAAAAADGQSAENVIRRAGGSVIARNVIQRQQSARFTIFSFGSGVRGEDLGYHIEFVCPR